MIENYFTDIITVCTPTYDEWDQVSWTYTSYSGRVENRLRTINVDGEQRQAKYKIFLSKSAIVSNSSRIYLGTVIQNTAPDLPDQIYQIIEIYYPKGFTESHIEVWV